MSDIVRKKLKVLNGSSFEPEITLKTVNNESLLGEGNVNTKYTAGSGIQIVDITNTISVDNTVALKSELANKQDIISDLATIRSGAALGATALQNVPNTYRTSAAQDIIDATKANISAIPTKTSDLTNDSGFLTEHQDISGKQDRLTAGTGITINNNTISVNSQSFNIDICYPNGSIYFSTKRDETTVNTDGKYGCVIANSGGYWVVYNTQVAPYAWERLGTAGYAYSSSTISITASNIPNKLSFMNGTATISDIAENYDKFILDSFTCDINIYDVSCEISGNDLIINISSTMAYPAGSRETVHVSVSGKFIRE